jgi:hypothetical protein
MKTQARLLALTTLITLLTLLQTAAHAATPLESISVQSRLDPNAILITEIDVVFIYDEALLPQVPTSKRAWYGNKRNFTRSAGAGLDVVNLFIPQGFDSDSLTLPARKAEALKVLVFAYHDSAEATPADITALTTVQIEIDPFGIRVK